LSAGVRRALLVVNPAARGNVGVAEEVVALIASTPGWEASQAGTDMRGHGVLLAEEAAAAGTDLVLGVGGDGTAREVAAGLAGSETVFGIVPAGTGNSSYKVLFGNATWREVLDVALAGEALGVRPIDLLRVDPTGELSLLGFSAGWFAQIIVLAAEQVGVEGSAKYATAALQAVENPTRFEGRVELDGRLLAEGELGLVAIGGSRVRGSVFPVLPKSLMDDGLLDVITVTAADPAEFGEMLALVHTEAHLDHRLVGYGQGTAVTIRSGSPLPAEIDGDIWDRHAGETTISVAPGMLSVLRPPHGMTDT
jgi:diacylglycerol kinase (ATP)